MILVFKMVIKAHKYFLNILSIVQFSFFYANFPTAYKSKPFNVLLPVKINIQLKLENAW